MGASESQIEVDSSHETPSPQTNPFDHVLTREELQEVFDSIDSDQRGVIDGEGLRRAWQRLSLPQAPLSLDTTFNHFDTNQDGLISFEEFEKMVEDNMRLLHEMFAHFDLDRSGSISRPDIVEALELLYQVRVPPEVIDALIHRADLDRNGELDFEEWCRFLMMLPLDETLSPAENAKIAFDFWMGMALLLLLLSSLSIFPSSLSSPVFPTTNVPCEWP